MHSFDTPTDKSLTWDVRTNQVQSVARPDRSKSWRLEDSEAVSPDGKLAVQAGTSHDKSLARLIDTRTGREIRTLDGDGGL